MSAGTCECGEPAIADGKCRRCYDIWRNATNPYRKRGRPVSAVDQIRRRELARRRTSR